MDTAEVKDPQNEAALKIQRLWRSYTNRKIYKYYRDIIYFKCKGNPAKLLKGINPAEAQLLEAATNCHIRFRLGGEHFPPNIYYKIFTKSNVIDINAFAPRDYASLPRNKEFGKITMEEYQSKKEQYEEEGWYLRSDRNGWRPISHKMFDKSDYVELYSANKVKYYHHKKEKREEKAFKKARMAKLRWLQNLYKNAPKDKDPNQQGQEENLKKIQDNGEGEMMNEEEDMELGYNDIEQYNPLKNPRLLEIEDEDQFQTEVQQLIEWSQNLDYESYAKDWFQLSTSEPSSKFVPTGVNAMARVLQQDAKMPIMPDKI